MDDLIRRSDAIEEVYKRIGADLDIDDVEYFEKIINSIPTAYNVDKVVEQLDANAQKMSEAKAIRPYAKCSPADHRYYKAISVKKAIELVKAGGVNG